MRKLIPSASFTEQIQVDIQVLKDAKKQKRAAKEQAKSLIEINKASLTKDEHKALKIDFVRAKLRHKAAKAALKAAKKVLYPYLLEEIVVKTNVEAGSDVAQTAKITGKAPRKVSKKKVTSAVKADDLILKKELKNEK